MSQLALDSASQGAETLICRLTPSGRIDVQPGSPEDGPVLCRKAAGQIMESFGKGRGEGVLYLGAAELSTDLPPSLSFWRDVGRAFVGRICGALDPTDPNSLVIPDPDRDELWDMRQAAPPMQGAELLTTELLADIWADAGAALEAKAKGYNDGVQGYLKAHSSVWHVVGRVCFHLAENKRDLEYPFAFIATYVHKVSKQAKPQHLPLGRALKDYAGAKNRQKLLTLLAPLSRAAEQSAFVRELVDAGDIYHPLRWTPKEAHRFLCEIALYEQAGLIVRMPDWWSAKSKPRPRVSVSVGGKPPSSLGMDALLDFDVRLTRCSRCAVWIRPKWSRPLSINRRRAARHVGDVCSRPTSCRRSSVSTSTWMACQKTKCRPRSSPAGRRDARRKPGQRRRPERAARGQRRSRRPRRPAPRRPRSAPRKRRRPRGRRREENEREPET